MNLFNKIIGRNLCNPDDAKDMKQSDLGHNKCPYCGKMVMGYKKGNQVKNVHAGVEGEWRRVK